MDGWVLHLGILAPMLLKEQKKVPLWCLHPPNLEEKNKQKSWHLSVPPNCSRDRQAHTPPFPFFTPMCFCLPLLGCLVYLVYLVCLKVVQHQEKNKLIMGLAKLVPPPLSPVGRWQMQVLCLKKKKYNEWKRKRKKKTGFSIRHEQTWRRIRQQRLAPFYSPMAVWDRQQRRSPYSKVSR